jgi:allophanate hydrolase
MTRSSNQIKTNSLTPGHTSGWTISEWLNAYRQQNLSPRDALLSLCEQLSRNDNAWIYIVSADELNSQLEALDTLGDPNSLPLYAVPFAVKDNIDVAGIPTTAACPAFTYIPEADATSVARLKAAGAIVIGKTNLDQFATGLVGTRSPYGAVSNAFQPEYVSGGSSSGSAVAVARGQVPFSLGTDTAGSGRVPAGFNNIIGLKPTKGRFSTKGVVPACRSLDCVSIFSLNIDDAELIASLMEGFDLADGYSRTAPAPATQFPAKPRFAIPASPNWFGDEQAQAAWEIALEKMRALDVELVELDFTPMFALAQLLYGGAWVAERHAAIGDFMKDHADEMNEVVRSIVEKAANFSASDTFKAEYQRAQFAQQIQLLISRFDALLVPTSPRHPTIAQVAADPIGVNNQLGTYTNFVNLADLSALALPASIRADGLPFGITLIANAWQDSALTAFGKKWHAATDLPLGAIAKPQPNFIPAIDIPQGYVRLAVVGAHLTGMPLNVQLQERNALFVESTFTAKNYRLFALPNTTPPKPGLIRIDSHSYVESEIKGAEIIVELWDVPVQHFGSFVALIPAPLGIGTLTLNDGREVKGFICEGVAVKGATDITHLGGWRAYIKSLQK